MVRVQLVEQIDQVLCFINISLVQIARLRENSADSLTNLVGEAASLRRRRSVTLGEGVVIVSSFVHFQSV